MAASTTGFPIASPIEEVQPTPGRLNRRRRIDPVSGRALEILGHAIEYLTDELANGGGPLSAGNPQVEAIQLLMSLNRQVYFECPEVQTLGDRCRSFFRFRSA